MLKPFAANNLNHCAHIGILCIAAPGSSKNRLAQIVFWLNHEQAAATDEQVIMPGICNGVGASK